MRSISIRILAVDDEPDLCIMTKEFLTGAGELSVDTAFSVAEARIALAKRRYDAIVSDYQMPGEDGLQFLKSLRGSGDHTPFILFTGKGREEVVIEALNNGADSYLQKGGSPIPLYTELSHRIHALVQRKGVERALEESEDQHRIIFDQSPIAIELYDASGTLVHANPSCLRLFGVDDVDAVRGFSLFDDPSISDENLIQMHRGDNIRYEGPFDFEKVRGLNLYQTTRRGVIWLDVLITPLRIGREPITGFLVQVQDITERKVAEDQLAQAKEQLKLAIEGSGVGLWDRNVQTGTGEFRVQKADCSRCWLRSRDVVFERDPDGTARSGLGFSEDITERKRAEDSLRVSEERFRIVSQSSPDLILIQDRDLKYVWVLNPQLGMEEGDMIGRTDNELFPPEEAQRIIRVKREVMDTRKDADFSIWLPSRNGSMEYFDGVYRPRFGKDGEVDGIIGYFRNATDIIHAQEALREANRKLNLLTSITRHDILNQLMSLTGHLALMEGLGDQTTRQHLHKAESAAQHILSIIEFTRTYEDLGVHAPTWQDVRLLVEKCSKGIQHGHVTIHDDIPPGCEVFADSLIVKVFCNLIDNTLRHGVSTSMIRFSMGEGDGVRSVVYEDDGIGVPADMKENIFRRGSGKDHGLGLFLSREILAITEITITEEGEPGKGARFVLRAPPGSIRDVPGAST